MQAPRKSSILLALTLGSLTCLSQQSDQMMIVEHLNGITDGQNRVFNLRHGSPEPESVALFRNGQSDVTDKFQISGQTLTFNSAPERDSVLILRYKPADGGSPQHVIADHALHVSPEELSAAIQREVSILQNRSPEVSSVSVSPLASRLKTTEQRREASTALLQRMLHDNRHAYTSLSRRHRSLESDDDSGAEGFVEGDGTNVFTLPLLQKPSSGKRSDRADVRLGSAPASHERLSSLRILSRTLSEADDAGDE